MPDPNPNPNPNPNPSPKIDVEKEIVDSVMAPASNKPSAIQSWVALVPLLSVMITAVALVVTTTFQIYQARRDSELKVDSDWRSALQRIDLDEKNAAVAALEMQSFLASSHSEQARSLASAAMPNIGNQDQFDTAFHVLVAVTDQRNQVDLIGIARSLSNQVGELYTQWLDNPNRTKPANPSMEEFVLNPEPFFDPKTEALHLKQALTKIWELDTVIGGLSSLWTSTDPAKAVHPACLDLAGIIFLNGDFTSVSFAGASLEHSEFIGKCNVDQKSLPPGTLYACQP